MKYSYEEMFQRNIGIFTEEEQKQIKNLKVSIAGAGGLGGELAYLLVRLGVMNIKICDPEEFEISNINRQFGCYVDTVGQNKANAVAKELLRINPQINIEVWDYGIDVANAARFVDGCDVVIDAIDFYSVLASVSLQEEARAQGKWVMAAQIVGSMASTINFKPGCPHYGDLFYENGRVSMIKVVNVLFPVLPKEATREMVARVVSGEKIALPSWSHASVVTALLLVEDLVSYFIKKEKELVVAPLVTMLDLFNKKYIKSNE